MFAGHGVFQHDESTAIGIAYKYFTKKYRGIPGFPLNQPSLQIEHLAMATRWRCWLAGSDGEQLVALGEWWREELDRWDRLLSKFDPASEVTRLNRALPHKQLKLNRDLIDLLNLCELALQETSGFFDITATSLVAGTCSNTERAKPFQVDYDQGTFTWTVANRQLDFGGVAKGYVLNQLAASLCEQGISAAMLDGGGSSLLTWDTADNGRPWLVSLAAPDDDSLERVSVHQADEKLPLDQPARIQVQLQNQALSYSATRVAGTRSGQSIDPRHGTELSGKQASVIITHSAAWAEVLSTATLCMGEVAASKYIQGWKSLGVQMIWLNGD